MDSLYCSLKAAHISEKKVTLENALFPVETDEEMRGNLGGTILLRKAHKDIWKICEHEMFVKNSRVMFIMGPSGVGKVINNSF
jgi:flagellar biosynthesis GTPase FlhF